MVRLGLISFSAVLFLAGCVAPVAQRPVVQNFAPGETAPAVNEASESTASGWQDLLGKLKKAKNGLRLTLTWAPP